MRYEAVISLDHHPLTSSLDELIHQKSDIVHHETNDIETKELRGMTRAKFQADLCLICMLETWVFDLAGNLV